MRDHQGLVAVERLQGQGSDAAAARGKQRETHQHHRKAGPAHRADFQLGGPLWPEALRDVHKIIKFSLSKTLMSWCISLQWRTLQQRCQSHPYKVGYVTLPPESLPQLCRSGKNICPRWRRVLPLFLSYPLRIRCYTVAGTCVTGDRWDESFRYEVAQRVRS